MAPPSSSHGVVAIPSYPILFPVSSAGCNPKLDSRLARRAACGKKKSKVGREGASCHSFPHSLACRRDGTAEEGCFFHEPTCNCEAAASAGAAPRPLAACGELCHAEKEGLYYGCHARTPFPPENVDVLA